MFDKTVGSFEKYIVRFLIIIILAFIVFQIVNLIQEFVSITVNYDFSLNNVTYSPFANVVLIFFDILIALELMETIKHNSATVPEKAKLIILIGLIAVTRKLISIDIKTIEYTASIALAALIISLTAGYFLLSNRSKK